MPHGVGIVQYLVAMQVISLCHVRYLCDKSGLPSVETLADPSASTH